METLAVALAKAQAEFTKAKKSAYNDHFKKNYSSIEDLVDATRPSLSKYGFSLIQYPTTEEQDTYLVTRLIHSSGQEISTKVKIFLKDPTDQQKFGAALSYIERYTYRGVCRISTSDDDDDGNSVSDLQPANPNYSQPKNSSSDPKSDAISPKQLGLLKAKLSGKSGKEQEICKHYQIASLGSLPWRKMQEVLDILEAGEKKQIKIDDEVEFVPFDAE